MIVKHQIKGKIIIEQTSYHLYNSEEDLQNDKRVMTSSDIKKIKSHIDEHRKSMSWYKRTKQNIRNHYLGYKYKFQDWIGN